MPENVKLRLTCCVIGAILWAILAPMLCLMCYDVLPQNSVGSDVAKGWAQHFGQAQKKMAGIGAICGLLLGFVTSILFERRPPKDHVIIRPQNIGKMFGLAPKTKASIDIRK